jgi:hypothetical protein
MKRKNNNFSKSIFTFIIFYTVLLLLRVWNGNFYLVDSYEYIEVAKHIIQGNYFITEDPIISRRPFVYPLFLALTFTLNPFVIVFFQSILLFLSFYFFYKTIDFYKIKNEYLLLILVLLTPAIFIYSQLVMSELLVLFLITVLFYLLIVHFEWKNIKYAQLIITLLAFTKPVFYPFVFVNLAIMLIYFFKVKRFNFWVLLPVLSVLLYINYNQNKFSYKHFSSMENKNLIHYNLYYFKAKNESKEIADQWISNVNKELEGKNENEKNELLKNIAHQEIKKNFLSYTFYHISTGIRGVFDPGRFDLMTFVEKEDGKQGFLEILNGNKPFSSLFSKKSLLFIYFLLIPIFVTLLFKWFHFFKFYLTKKRGFSEYYFLIFIGYYILITGPVNCSRYMMPLQLILITFVLVSVNENRLKNARQN